ncbi:MAG: hypothetical protein IKU29_00475 [Parabacteroides sp.]|nr:hypothetical protein [Parabacteroides sp.]
MALKKGQKIWAVYIDRGIVTAYTKDMTQIPLTRSERKVLSSYKNENYIENICKEFCHKEPLHEEFSIMKDGTLVFTLDKHLM